MNSLRKTMILAQMCRNISQSAVNRSVVETTTAKFNRLKEVQKKFQVDDGVPVHIKSGMKDKLLYQVTLLMTFVGIAMSGEVLYKLSFPKKE